jgi:hypothetical protein
VIGIFKQKSPANIFLLLIFGVLIKLPMFLSPHIPGIKPGDGLFYTVILDFLKPAASNNPSLFSILAFLLLFIQSVILTRFMNSQRLLNRPSFFPGMSYMLITSLFPEWNYFSAPLIVNTILLILLTGLFRIYNQPASKGAIFNIGLALGVSAFIFFPSVTFIFWILLALAIMRPFRINEWLICIAGAATPFYFYAVYLIFIDQWNWHNLIPMFSVSFPRVEQTLWLAGSAFLLAAPFLAGGYYVQDNLRKMLIQVRKGWSLLLIFLLGAIFIPFVNNSNTFENWVIVTIPFAAFHASAYFFSTYRIVPNLIFWLSIAFILAYQYTGPGW